MPQMTRYAPGTFCWVELATSDQNGAKVFYTSLFGWTYDDNPIGNGATYTMLKLRGRHVAALFHKGKEQDAIPSHWLSYVAVADADAAASRVTELGGTLLLDPFDVMDVGRMAVANDPTGAVFALWQGNRHAGAGIVGEPGAFCWNELSTMDTDTAGAFYAGLFGWGTKATPMAMGPDTYTIFTDGERQVAGMMKMMTEWAPGIPPYWLAYFAVGDCDASVARAKELGAKEIVPPTDIPNVGRFAVLADPQGAMLALIRLIG